MQKKSQSPPIPWPVERGPGQNTVGLNSPLAPPPLEPTLPSQPFTRAPIYTTRLPRWDLAEMPRHHAVIPIIPVIPISPISPSLQVVPGNPAMHPALRVGASKRVVASAARTGERRERRNDDNDEENEMRKYRGRMETEPYHEAMGTNEEPSSPSWMIGAAGRGRYKEHLVNSSHGKEKDKGDIFAPLSYSEGHQDYQKSKDERTFEVEHTDPTHTSRNQRHHRKREYSKEAHRSEALAMLTGQPIAATSVPASVAPERPKVTARSFAPEKPIIPERPGARERPIVSENTVIPERSVIPERFDQSGKYRKVREMNTAPRETKQAQQATTAAEAVTPLVSGPPPPTISGPTPKLFPFHILLRRITTSPYLTARTKATLLTTLHGSLVDVSIRTSLELELAQYTEPALEAAAVQDLTAEIESPTPGRPVSLAALKASRALSGYLKSTGSGGGMKRAGSDSSSVYSQDGRDEIWEDFYDRDSEDESARPVTPYGPPKANVSPEEERKQLGVAVRNLQITKSPTTKAVNVYCRY